jgi:7-carboxy-7-deazaguanine synthase
MVSKNSKLRVNEMFGPTVQGEGPYMGRPTIFIRLAGCTTKKPRCLFCDSKYSWSTKDAFNLSIDIIVNECKIRNPKIKFVVVTGGEPLMQAPEVAKLVSILASQGYAVQIETSGKVWPAQSFLNTFMFSNTSLVISPKFIKGTWQVEKGVFKYPAGFRKFVISESQDFNRVQKFLKHSVMNNPNRVYLMPEGISRDAQTGDLARQVWEYCAKEGFNFSSRLHTLLYGNKRGI